MTEPVKDDISAQVGDPVVAQDFSDPIAENSTWCLLSPGVNDNAYIQSSDSDSSDVTTPPFVPMENGLTSSGVSALEPPMDVQHDGVLTITEFTSLLHYVIAFSRLSCLPCASPPTVPNSACFKIDHTPPPGQTDISASYTDDSSSELSNPSALFKESISTTFVRPASPLPPSSPGFVNDYPMEYPNYAPISPFPSQPSPVSSSSPPNFFTSSPTRHAMYKSPPTSPGPAEGHTVVHSTVSSNPLKRPHSPEAVITSLEDHNEGLEEQTAKKKVRYTHDTEFVILTLSLEVEHQ